MLTPTDQIVSTKLPENLIDCVREWCADHGYEIAECSTQLYRDLSETINITVFRGSNLTPKDWRVG